MRQEEIRSDQHVGRSELEIREPQVRVLDLLGADLEALHRRQPVPHGLPPDAIAITCRHHIRSIGFHPGSPRTAQRDHTVGGTTIEHHVDLHAVEISDAGGMGV